MRISASITPIWREYGLAEAQIFEQLKQEFTLQEVKERLNISSGGAHAQVKRWTAQGLCERTAHGRYKKKIGAAAV